jgi:hypothetical protein
MEVGQGPNWGCSAKEKKYCLVKSTNCTKFVICKTSFLHHCLLLLSSVHAFSSEPSFDTNMDLEYLSKIRIYGLMTLRYFSQCCGRL